MELCAGGFQCPDNGVPCVLMYDEDNQTVYAELENNGFDIEEDMIKEAEAWCERYNKTKRLVESFEDACWMPDAIERRN